MSRVLVALMVMGLAACSDPEEKPVQRLTLDELMDPESCKTCHPEHYEEWSGSMHAYAADDPLFLAMNQRGQRETNGELGDFCIKCHAPLAVELGLTTDGTNLDEVPRKFLGVTCYFCHTVTAVEGTHNNPLVLSGGEVLFGGIQDPLENSGHLSKYSPLHDRETLESSQLCGSCHDIVTPAGVHLERTFAEWQETVFSEPDAALRLSCGECHMDGRQSPVADYPGVQVRRAHSHATPAVDVALTPWPQMAEQRTAIEEMLDTTLLGRICVEQGVAQAAVDITLENVAAGHSWPSGSAQDRRAWLELVAYEGGEVTYSTGVVEEGEPVVGRDDPDLWQFRDYLLGEDGEEVHMFWDATDVVSELIAGSKSFEDDPQHLVPIVGRRFRVPGNPERVTMQVRMRPVGLDVIDDLIESGDLDPIYRATIPTYDLASTKIEWTPELGAVCNPPLD